MAGGRGERKPHYGPPKNKTGARVFTARMLEREVMRLRMMGLTYREIAEALNRPKSTVHKAAQRALQRIQEETAEEARTYQGLQRARLERMLAALWPRVIRGDTRAIQAASGVIAELNRLMGLHRLEVTGVMGLQLEWPDVVGELPDQGGDALEQAGGGEEGDG